MRTPLRLGAIVTLGALLLVGMLASPALAWHSTVHVKSFCKEGKVVVVYFVKAWEEGHTATVDVSYQVDDGAEVPLPSGAFTEDDSGFGGHFDLPAGTTGTVTVTAVADWDGAEDS